MCAPDEPMPTANPTLGPRAFCVWVQIELGQGLDNEPQRCPPLETLASHLLKDVFPYDFTIQVDLIPGRKGDKVRVAASALDDSTDLLAELRISESIRRALLSWLHRPRARA